MEYNRKDILIGQAIGCFSPDSAINKPAGRMNYSSAKANLTALSSGKAKLPGAWLWAGAVLSTKPPRASL